MSLKSTITILAACVAGMASAQSLFTDNGHYYKLVTGVSPTWDDAKDAAAMMTTVQGGKLYQGYLATVTSAAENTFITGLGAVDGLYLGGFYNGPPVGQYKWITGEAFTYSNWAAGEPNGDSGVIQYAVGGAGKWNDLPGGAPPDGYAGTTYVRGYVVEFSAVPGPAAAIPFAIGFLRRRRKQA